jgi:hypothetical protein
MTPASSLPARNGGGGDQDDDGDDGNGDGGGYEDDEQDGPPLRPRPVSEQIKLALHGLPSPATGSTLVIHFAFVMMHAYQDLCRAVVEVMAPDTDFLETDAVFATPTEAGTTHENWMCRLRGGAIDWFFLTTHNLTPASWGPRARNYEFGVLHTSPPAALTAHVQTLVDGQRRTSSFRCHRPVPDDSTPALTGAVFQREGQCQFHNDPLDPCSTQVPLGFRWGRILGRLHTYVLPKIKGGHDLLKHEPVPLELPMRFALYHILFQDLISSHTRRPTRVDEVREAMMATLRRRPRALVPYWAMCASAQLTFNALADLYIRWWTAFSMFDPRILYERPIVSTDTIVTGPGALVSHTATHDTPYDAVSFLLQNMYNDIVVWWTCPLGHRVLWPVRRMMTLIKPSCLVCTSSMDIRILYDALSRMPGVTCVTVEMPLKKLSTTEADLVQEVQEDADDQDVRLQDGVDGQTMYMKENNTAFLKEMRYDVFFIYKGELCGIELDDNSHSTTPFRDATKNIVSLGMGVHLLRVLALRFRTNAAARLELLLRYFLSKIQGARLLRPPLQDIKTWMLNRHLKARSVPGAVTTRQMMASTWRGLPMPVYVMGSVDVPAFSSTGPGALLQDMTARAKNESERMMEKALGWSQLVSPVSVRATADIWSQATGLTSTIPPLPATTGGTFTGHAMYIPPPLPPSIMCTGRVIIERVTPTGSNAKHQIVARPLDASRTAYIESPEWTVPEICAAARMGDCETWGIRHPAHRGQPNTAPPLGAVCGAEPPIPNYPAVAWKDTNHQDIPVTLLANPKIFEGMLLTKNGVQGRVVGGQFKQGSALATGDWSVYVKTPRGLESWILKDVVPDYDLGRRVAARGTRDPGTVTSARRSGQRSSIRPKVLEGISQSTSVASGDTASIE